jgi:hypothetical protein
MARLVTMDCTLEKDARFVEETAPSAIVAETIAQLRKGKPKRDLLRAAAIAVSRSTDLPVDHHGGPVHPIAGVHAVADVTTRLKGDWAYMPVVHSVALANKHCHHPEMGPALMPEIPRNGKAIEVDAEKLNLRMAIDRLEPNLAQRALVELVDRCKPGEILDLMADQAIRRNPLDDHYFLYPVLAVRCLEDIGWDCAAVVLRPPIRFLSTNARTLGLDGTEFNLAYVRGNVASLERFADEVDDLLEKNGLEKGNVPLHTSPAESPAVGMLARVIGASTDFREIPELVARALGKGLSLEGAAEAMSIGGSMIHLRTDYGNPFDVHFATGMNTRRYLIAQPEVSLRRKITALLCWSYSPEIRLSEDKMVWPLDDDGSPGPAISQHHLLDQITEAIMAHPRRAALEASQWAVEKVAAGQETREIMALARRYVADGFEPAALFARLAEIICRDDFAEMHTFKHIQCLAEEHAATREPFKGVHLVSAVKEVACSYGIVQDVYTRAREHLAI